jgi:uncharacterized integral membrane protein
MRIISVFIWIIIFAICLLFFVNNLGQYVDINVFQTEYQNVNLVVVIFISFFIGIIVGAIVLSIQILNIRGEYRAVKRENAKLLKELDGLRNLSIDEIPDADTQISTKEVPTEDI